MDAAQLWVNLGIFVASAAAATIAWAQAIRAGQREGEAAESARKAEAAREKAVAAQESAAAALAEANTIATDALETQRKALPPPWSLAQQIDQGIVGFENQSSQTIVVTGITPNPTEPPDLVITDRPPFHVEYGDRFKIYINFKWRFRPHSIEITWRFMGEEETHVTTRKL